MKSIKLAQRLSAVWGAVLLLMAGASIAADQTHFPTPEAAAQALVDAAATEGRAALLAVLGPDLDELTSGDVVDDARERAEFVEAALQSAGIEQETVDRAVLIIGPDDWPFPVPLVQRAEGWYFDTAAGREELLNRRVGRNELATIEVARAFVEAQYEYAQEDRNGDGVKEFAQKLMSDDGLRDGLYWVSAENEPESPMGELVAAAWAQGYRPGTTEGPRPYHGYLYRLVTAQGEHAPGGARSYLQDGHLTEGFGLVAWPFEYGNSGIMTFQLNQSGILYQKDLGADTATEAPTMEAYDPGPDWEPISD